MKHNHSGFGQAGLLLMAVLVSAITVTSWIVYKTKYDSRATGNGQRHTPGGIAVTTKPDLSGDRTLRDNQDQVLIDFSKCKPDVRRFDVNFGSTTVEITGKENNICSLNYGGEVENPDWDGKLTSSCKIPASLGERHFRKGRYGVDLSAIRKYCSI